MYHSAVCSQAVRLVAELCLEYEVYDLQLWNSVLQKLMSFNMVSLLCYCPYNAGVVISLRLLVYLCTNTA